MKLPIVTECQDCQAIVDARRIFQLLERIGETEGVGPDRMLRAIAAMHADWLHTLALVAEAEDGTAPALTIEDGKAAFLEALANMETRTHADPSTDA